MRERRFRSIGPEITNKKRASKLTLPDCFYMVFNCDSWDKQKNYTSIYEGISDYVRLWECK